MTSPETTKKQNPVLAVLYKVGGFFHKLNGMKWYGSLVSGLICVVLGLLAGFIIMLCVDAKAAGQGLGILITHALSSNPARVFYLATPMMLSGLSIAFSFKLGLFNIGITGQVTAGAFFSLVCGIAGANWFVCLLVGMISGGIMGLIPGFLKAKFNVNEVLSGIMLNWIIYYIIGLIGLLALDSSFKDKNTPAELINMPVNGRMPSMGLTNGLSIGLIIALVIVVIFEIILVKTKFGFELKLTGSNKFAAQYAGMNQTKNIVLAMMISGALAGICGYMLYANPLNPSRFHWDSSANSLIADGFTGISVSLIAQNSPIGCVLSSVLLAMIDGAQSQMKNASAMFNVHYTELIKNIIIYVASFSAFFCMILRYLYEKKEEKLHKKDINADTLDGDDSEKSLPAETQAAPETKETVSENQQ